MAVSLTLLPSRQSSFLFEVELFTLLRCQPYEQSWSSALLALLRYAPQVITFLLYFGGLRYKELYLLLFGLGLSLNSVVNQLLNRLLPSEPRVTTCTPMHGAGISWQAQQVAFFTLFSLGYAALYQARLKLWHTVALTTFLALTVLSQDALNYHTTEATVIGAVLGCLLALLYQSFLYAVIVPSFRIVLRSSLVRYLAYQDTLCFDSLPSDAN
jgi:hypothetical protein